MIMLLLGFAARNADAESAPITLRPHDVVVFVGGADVVATQETGHLEALLTLKYPSAKIRYRNMGWEGDTVFEQPRDFNYPPLRDQLARAGATIVFLQFGQIESLRGPEHLQAFIAAYETLLHEFTADARRFVLVVPPPFESAGGKLPDLSLRNDDLAAYANAIRSIAERRRLPLIDLFHRLRHDNRRRTSDGMHLTAQGHAIVAAAAADQLGLSDIAASAGMADGNGSWPNASFDELRRQIVTKNRLWFDYWRPMNWAFLGGDRIEQPSSRDHLDPSVRWFPREMERFVPLIEKAEARIEATASSIDLQ